MTLAEIVSQMRAEGRLPVQVIEAFAAFEQKIAVLEKALQGKTPAKGR